MHEAAAVESFTFDDQFQQTVLALMMTDGDFCFKSAFLLKPQYFKNQYYGTMYEIIANLYKEFVAAPTPMQVINELMKLKPEQRPPYAALLENVLRKDLLRNGDFVRSRLQHFVKRAKLWQINQKLVSSKFTNPDELYDYATKEIQEFESISFDKDEVLTPRDIDRVMAESADASKNLIPLGIPTVDEALGGGVPRGTLTTALGGTNIGKSIWLVNAADSIIKASYRVLYVNLEGQRNQPLLRLVARAIQVPYGRVRFNRLTDAEHEKKRRYVESIGDRIHIKHVNSFGYTVEELYSYCRTKKDSFDFDVLVVDYGQLLFSKMKQEGLRHTQAYVHRCLASLASNMDVAVITVAQGTRDVQNKNRRGTDLLRMDDISECFEICRVSAQVVTLNRSETDEANERCRILLDKQRDGRRGVVEICRTNFSTVSMYGSKEDGLGFISPDEYLAEELESASKEERLKNA